MLMRPSNGEMVSSSQYRMGSVMNLKTTGEADQGRGEAKRFILASRYQHKNVLETYDDDIEDCVTEGYTDRHLGYLFDPVSAQEHDNIMYDILNDTIYYDVSVEDLEKRVRSKDGSKSEFFLLKYLCGESGGSAADVQLDKELLNVLERGKEEGKVEINEESLYRTLCASRSVKTQGEVQKMKEASKIGESGHEFVMKNLQAGMREFDLANGFSTFCRMNGSDFRMPYHPIVAGGKNGAVLHYRPRDVRLEKGEMVLCDMGCSVDGYACDITRTYPVSGRFTKEQKELYEVVLRTADHAIGSIRVGAKFLDVQNEAYEVLCDGLHRIGILRGSLEDQIKAKVYRTFMPHSLGHFLGLYVHDVGPVVFDEDKKKYVMKSINAVDRLESGMVTTVEPGIYFIDLLLKRFLESSAHSNLINVDVLNKYRSIGGIRLEDNIVVGGESEGSSIIKLTERNRTVDEIEHTMNMKD